MLGAKQELLTNVGSLLLDNWQGIKKIYRPTCGQIISYALSHELFDESDLKNSIFSISEGKKDDHLEAVELLVKANILSGVGNHTYTIHSKVENIRR